MSFEPGSPLPDLTVAASGGQTLRLKDYKGKPLVVYFYPKDNTPGCTQEGQDFRDLYPAFQSAGCSILGVSRDGVKSHDNFIAKYDFPFSLISDPDETVCKAFDVIKEKKLYGRTYMGVERSTFLFDAKGKLHQAWRGVKVKGHAQAVLDAVNAL
jgi:thioredoxin-dependent peroxiredoxin